jgi:hypothetical protein
MIPGFLVYNLPQASHGITIQRSPEPIHAPCYIQHPLLPLPRPFYRQVAIGTGCLNGKTRGLDYYRIAAIISKCYQYLSQTILPHSTGFFIHQRFSLFVGFNFV